MATNIQRIWREMWLVTVLITLSICYTQGAQYANTRMREVTSFTSSPNTICVTARSKDPRVTLRVKLFVTSVATNDLELVGDVNIKHKLLAPPSSTHQITIQHVPEGRKFSLKVLLDGTELEFIPNEDINAFVQDYRFDRIALLLKGTADIDPCEETTLPTNTTSTTTTTAKPAPTATTTLVWENVIGGGEEEEEKEGEKEEEKEEERKEEEHVDSPINFPLGEHEVAEHENEHYLGAEVEHDGENVENNDNLFRRSVFIMGDFKGVPVLLLLVVLFCVGVGIGSVGTILCEQYCCSCKDDDEENKLHDASFDHRMIARTDFHGLSDDPMYNTSLSQGRITKDSISHPIQTNAQATPHPYGAPHYMSPRDREWQREQMEYQLRNSSGETQPYRNSSDETLPLNVPLPQENQNPHTSSGSSYERYDPYRETSLNL